MDRQSGAKCTAGESTDRAAAALQARQALDGLVMKLRRHLLALRVWPPAAECRASDVRQSATVPAGGNSNGFM
jgi:hypothetical protein